MHTQPRTPERARAFNLQPSVHLHRSFFFLSWISETRAENLKRGGWNWNREISPLAGNAKRPAGPSPPRHPRPAPGRARARVPGKRVQDREFLILQLQVSTYYICNSFAVRCAPDRSRKNGSRRLQVMHASKAHVPWPMRVLPSASRFFCFPCPHSSLAPTQGTTWGQPGGAVTSKT